MRNPWSRVVGGVARAFVLVAATSAACTSPVEAPPDARGAAPATEVPSATQPPAPTSRAADVVPGAADVAEVRRLFATRVGSHATTREFARAFARSDWDAFDATADAELLRTGLAMTASDALDAGDGPLAVRALERRAQVAADDDERARLRVRMSSLACALAGDTGRALRMLDEAVATLTDEMRGWALVHRGDVRALTGDSAGAKSDWGAALEFPYAEGEAKGPVEDVRRAAFVRCRFVGTAAPKLEDAEWIGGGPETSDSLRGRVAVVHVMETECRSCRETESTLGRVAKEREVAVFALTFPVRRGFLPTPGGNPFHEGDPVDRIPPGGHTAHLTDFRARLGDAPPIGVLAVGKWLYWRGPGDHPLHVVGRSGRIVFSQGASRPIGMVHAFVRRELAEPAGTGGGPPR